MKKLTLTIAMMAVLTVWAATGPYITVQQMKSAAERHDGEALSEHIEFPSIRQSLKDQINAMLMNEMAKDEMKDNPFAALGAAFGGFMVDKMVEAYVTPACITHLMAGEKPKPREEGESGGSSARKPLSDASMSFESVNKFVVQVKDDSGKESTFVLRRRGIGWKLTEIIVPLGHRSGSPKRGSQQLDYYSEITRNNLSKAGWSWGCVATVEFPRANVLDC